MDRIIELISRSNGFMIFGTGTRARNLTISLNELGYMPSGYIVSDGYGMDNAEYKAFELSEWMRKKKDELVLFAIDHSYYEQIRNLIGDNCVEITDADVCRLRRLAHPVDSNLFLQSRKPVSSIYGFDRGKPIDRWFIEKFLKEQSHRVKKVKHTLEVGDDLYSRLYFDGKDIKHDVMDYKQGMDLTDIESLPKEAYDIFISTQVFNFIYNIEAAINGAHKLLKPGGALLCTVAGNICQVSWHDMNDYGDFWRFTPLSIKRIVEDVFGNKVEVYPFGNAAVATAFIQGLAVEDLTDQDILNEVDEGYSICIGIYAEKGVEK